MLENKIMFLILAMLCMFLLFTDSGRDWLEAYLGVSIEKK